MTNPITIPGSGVELRALDAPGRGRIPILLIHENRGLVPYMLDVIAQLSDRGHRVVAPDLLTRIGGTPAFADDPTSVTTRQIDEDTHVADLVAAYDWLALQEPELAVVGFCFGGEMGWRLITHRTPEIAVLWYGVGPDPSRVERIHSRVYAAYAQHDDRVNDTLPPLCDAVRHSTADVTMESFPGTLHAFGDHTRPDRFAPAAADGLWHRTLRFLDSG